MSSMNFKMMMNVPSYCVLLVLAFALISGIHARWDDSRERGEEGKKELSDKEIRERLDVLTNEVIQLKKNVRELQEGQRGGGRKQTVNSIDENETTTDRDGEEEEEEEEVSDDEFKILSASRKALPDGKLRYTIRYRIPDVDGRSSSSIGESSSDGGTATMPSRVLVQWRPLDEMSYGLIPEAVSNEIPPPLPRGVRETSILTTASNSRNGHLMATIGYHEHWVRLYLSNDSEEDETVTDIETPILDISPKGDIVYEPGHNATFKVTHPKENRVRQGPGSMISSEHVRLDYMLTKPGDSNMVTFMNRDEEHVVFHQQKEEQFLDKVENTFVVDTENIAYSGMLDVLAGVTFNNNNEQQEGLVKKVENNKRVFLRPSTQKGPFPPGKIYQWRIPHPGNNMDDENGNVISFCGYGKTCPKYCQIFGDDLTSLRLFKTANGRTTREPMEILGEEDGVSYPYQKGGEFEVSPVEGEDLDPVSYTCEAGNAHGQTASFTTIFVFGYDVEIVANETMVQRFENGTAQVVCTARGLPLPKVSVQCDYSPADVTQERRSEEDALVVVEATCENFYPSSSMQCSGENDFESDYYDSGWNGNSSWDSGLVPDS